MAEAAGVASMGVFLQPLEATRAFPPPLLTTRSLGSWGNVAAARVFRVLGQLPFARPTAAFRRSLGLPPLGTVALFRRLERDRWPILYGISPSVVPVPEDWPAYRPMTGYWWPLVTGAARSALVESTPPDRSAGASPDRSTGVSGELSAVGVAGLSGRLRRFLDEGEPPVFVGFGSMTAPGLSEHVGEFLARLGRRVVVQRGAAGLSAEGADVLVVDDEPHGPLFPRVAVVVHHGGAGTTAATLRAGVPSVCVPFTADQPFWAKRLVALGAAPPPVPLKKLTPSVIAAAEACRPAAEAVSRRLAREDGLSDAVARIEQLLS
jgi:hypothetical protein